MRGNVILYRWAAGLTGGTGLWWRVSESVLFQIKQNVTLFSWQCCQFKNASSLKQEIGGSSVQPMAVWAVWCRTVSCSWQKLSQIVARVIEEVRGGTIGERTLNNILVLEWWFIHFYKFCQKMFSFCSIFCIQTNTTLNPFMRLGFKMHIIIPQVALKIAHQFLHAWKDWKEKWQNMAWIIKG